VHAKRAGEFELTQRDFALGVYRKLVVAEGKLIGAVLVGSPDEADDIVHAVRERAAVSTLSALLQRGTWQRRAQAA
jgi:NAD(P)H-nitrite reductase large subunit